MRQIIESHGRFNWQLAVCNDDVTASVHYPGVESIYVTTADFGLGFHDAGRDECDLERVLSVYRRRSQTETTYDDLLEQTLAALTDRPTPTTTTARPVATDGGTPEESGR